MKALKILSLIVINILSLGACRDQDKGTNNVVVENSFSLGVVDSKGNDLLDPSASNSYKEGDIKLFYLIDGVKKEVNDPSKDNPKGFVIKKVNDKYRLVFFANTSNARTSDTVTYIQWNSDNTDKITSHYYVADGITSLREVWLNDNSIWKSSSGEAFYKIINK